MLYSKEQAEVIDKELAQIRSSESNGQVLCQFEGRSCVRCCLPHIGGDNHMTIGRLEGAEEFNRDNNQFFLKYGQKYVGPYGLVMKFKAYHPLNGLEFEISHYENSFKDVGKREMERRFRKRFDLFKEIFSIKKPVKSLLTYWEKIKKAEHYKFKSNKEDLGSGIFAMFLGGGIDVRSGEKGKIPECQMLGFLDKKKSCVGCLAHPKSPFTDGFDGRARAGFYAGNDSCNVNCTAKEEFQYLGENAIKLFDKFTKKMSWYEYSRHSTAVLVSYLRVYEPVIERIAQNGKIEMVSLEQLVNFTNQIFKNVPYC